jgi:predicted NUDIX family NTP pyrophosphohydrolase
MKNFKYFCEKTIKHMGGGILMYHVTKKGKIKVFLILPHSFNGEVKWGIPKGKQDEGERLFQTAKREFVEETGIKLKQKDIEFIDLGVTKRGAKPEKSLYIWAINSSGKEKFIKSNKFEIEWPPNSGKKKKFPEIDRGEWFDFDEALQHLQQYQKTYLLRLKNYLKLGK